MSSTFSSLFPLPLTPFEQFLLAEDREEYPACPVVMAELCGELDESIFRVAVRQALKRHPLFNATVRFRSFRTPQWVENTQEPEISFQPMGASAGDGLTMSAADHFERIDLTVQPGLRLRVVVGPDRATIFFQAHHCCADGPGMHRFLGDVLALYGQMTAFDDPPELLPLDPLALRRRNEWPPHLLREFRTAHYWTGYGYSLYQYLTRIPAPLIADSSASGRPHVAACTTYLERDELRRLRRVLQERQITVHDQLACELLRCLWEWNTDRGGSDSQLLRLVVPTDLRGGDRGALPAANCLHVAFFGFRLNEIAASRDLAADCQAKMKAIFDSRSSTHFDLGLAMASAVPGLVGFLARRSQRKGTAILSSLGDPTRFYAARLPRRDGRPVAGPLTLERVAVRSLVRPGTYLNISTSTLAERLAISATVDEGHLGPGTAQFFAHRLRQQLVAHLPERDGR